MRHAAYRSLRKISTQNHFADWLFGGKAERSKAVSAWKDWRLKEGAGLK